MKLILLRSNLLAGLTSSGGTREGQVDWGVLLVSREPKWTSGDERIPWPKTAQTIGMRRSRASS